MQDTAGAGGVTEGSEKVEEALEIKDCVRDVIGLIYNATSEGIDPED